jgi:hypothetical protein
MYFLIDYLFMALQPSYWALALVLYTVVGVPRPRDSPPQGLCLQTEQTPLPRVGFEPRTLAFETILLIIMHCQVWLDTEHKCAVSRYVQERSICRSSESRRASDVAFETARRL